MKKLLFGIVFLLGLCVMHTTQTYADCASCQTSCNSKSKTDFNSTTFAPSSYDRCMSSCDDNACAPGAPEKSAAEQQADSAKQKQSCVTYMDKATTKGNICASAYSCESLFTSRSDALRCNYKRCINVDQRGTEYCSCKYGKDGSGTGVGIPLNTDIPFIGKCVGKSNGSTTDTAALTAFPTIIQAASRILVTVILLSGFIMIVVGGVQWASGDAKSGKAKITKVAIGFALLGMMGAILRLINPNFFK